MRIFQTWPRQMASQQAPSIKTFHPYSNFYHNSIHQLYCYFANKILTNPDQGSSTRCCRRNCMPDSKCSENQEGCLYAEDCDTGLHTPPSSSSSLKNSKKSSDLVGGDFPKTYMKGFCGLCLWCLLWPNCPLQALSATVLLLVHTASTSMSAQVRLYSLKDPLPVWPKLALSGVF